ncbi:hypothetical protein EZV62_015341 [Acer yangbiense]|uniref:WRKY domain-containing protein n=1 Tax=Acer yangbiense TaxID=1000413 RepID=A0A5C7HMB7_9ROSI|nr:hypothetical protein EZV62_015341 [Acer yangbiense]
MESPCSWPENISNRTKAIEELVKGRDFALQLRRILNKLSSENNNNNNNNDDDGDGVVLDQDLVLKILTSFTNSLSILKNGGGGGSGEYQSDHEVSQIQTNATHLNWDGRKPEDSGDSSKTSSIVNKDRRGCYKRRKCSDSEIKDSPNLLDDGHAWRKYGQKDIQNAKYPRNYFRCTHKHDQGCLATKQVQRIQEDPPLYRTTYSGRHTCKNLQKASQLFIDSRDIHHNSPMISFCDDDHKQNNNNNMIIINNNNHNPFLSSSFPSSIKQEYKDFDHDIMTHNNNYQSESSDHYILSPDDDHHHHQLTTTYDSGVVNSSSLSYTDMGTVMVEDSVANFDDDVLFDF